MNETTNDAAAIFAPLWKRKWLILAVALLVAAGTYEYYKHKPAVYSATTQLFLGGAAEQQGTGAAAPVKTLSGRALADQVGLINSGVIGKPVREKLRAEHELRAVKGKAVATASGSSDFITITTEAKGPRPAVNLANAYAQAYIKRQRSDYLRNVRAQIANTHQQLRRIEAPAPIKGKGAGKGSATSSTATLQAANLASKISQLESALSTFAGVQQVSPAKANPLPLSPTPKKNAIFGFVLGLILACVAAYGLSRFDRRIRTLAEIETIFGTQILAALPSVRSPVVRPDGKRAPAKSLVEPLRRLHTTLQVGDLVDLGAGRTPRVILFLSPDAGDGRSTLVANLARVQASAGERVAIVEADFRRPSQARLFDLTGPHGLADVLAGRAGLGQAMQSGEIPASAEVAPAPPDRAGAPVTTVLESNGAGSLSVLVGGGEIANPPALLAGHGMSELLRSVAGEYDYVLIDAPPPLEVSDAMALLQLVDGIVLVARIGQTRDVSAQRLAQLLQRSASAPLLGAVANCVPRKDIERYGFAWAPSQRGRSRLISR
jgi:non-specific protein-tyrosine kinase